MLEDRKLETFSKSYAIIIYNRFYNLIIRQEEPWLGDVARMLEDNGLPGHAVDDAVRKWAAHDYNL